MPHRLAGTGAVVDDQPEVVGVSRDRKSTRLNSSQLGISYAVFCLKKKNAVRVSLRIATDEWREFRHLRGVGFKDMIISAAMVILVDCSGHHTTYGCMSLACILSPE